MSPACYTHQAIAAAPKERVGPVTRTVHAARLTGADPRARARVYQVLPGS
ncbi:hypothetical protein [Streptomyces sp. NPDC048473]